jgi:hypothetical protein
MWKGAGWDAQDRGNGIEYVKCLLGGCRVLH